MKKFGLLGQNIKNSLSPKLHGNLAQNYNLELTYDLLECEEEDLARYLTLLKKEVYQGYNITKPFKEKIIPLLDELTPRAKKIQAVNTVYYENKRLIGDNTDYQGFMGLLFYYKVDVKNKHVYILGNGGASRAVFQVLLDLQAYPIIVYRKDSSKNLFTNQAISYENFKPYLADLIIHATSERTRSVVKENISDKTLIDLNYYPASTPIMQKAKKAYNGLIMLYIQALESQSIWHKQELVFSLEKYNQFKEYYDESLRK
ncbi:MAG: shikimate dehydrogenase [Acholeplasmataceae bacterium]